MAGGDGAERDGADGQGHAVVLGAGMSGLLAARALAEHFPRVTVVDRDRPPAGPVPRRGVPQGRHAHGLLARGGEALDRLLPGLTDELVRADAPLVRLMADSRYVMGGRDLARGDIEGRVVQATRPLLESVLRDRVAALGPVQFTDGHEVTGLAGDSHRVTGVRLRPRGAAAERTLRCRLVVDALGRGGRVPRWLGELGAAAPPEERLRIDLGYASRLLRLPEGALGGDSLVVIGAVPEHPTRGLFLMRQERDRWMLTVSGMAGDHPPSDDAEFDVFVRTIAPPRLADVLKTAEPVAAPARYHFPHSLRRHYQRLDAPPEGFLAVGDALCSFNPVYGQGMTVAALEAETLRRCLEEDGERRLARRYHRAAARVIDPAWRMALGADLAVMGVRGRRSLGTLLANHWLARVRRASAADPAVAARFVRVLTLQAPSASLLAPAVTARVLRAAKREPERG